MNNVINIKEGTILVCINENDSHYLKICQVKDIEYDEYYPLINNIIVKYPDEVVKYKAIDMEYNFIIVKGQTLTFD